MQVKDLTSVMENGACHVILIDNTTGEILLSTIWYNAIEEKHLNMQVKHICVRDYEMRLTVE